MATKERKVKCPICGTLNDKSNTIYMSNRYYCKQCAEEKKKSSKEYTDNWNRFYEYICKIYDIEKLDGRMLKQIKDFRSEPYKYTLEGMYCTLKYYYETLEHPVKEGVGLGIIPYYYEQTKYHYKKIMNVIDKLEECEQKDEKQLVVHVKSKERNKHVAKQLDFKSIDWSEDKYDN